MKIRKIFKFMLLLIAVGLLLFLWKIIVSEVVSTNLKLSQGNLWILTIIYWIELLPVLLIYDVVIIMIFSKILAKDMGTICNKNEKVRDNT